MTEKKTMRLIYDGNEEQIIAVIEDDLGPKRYHVCAKCAVRTSSVNCPRFIDCFAKSHIDGAPWTLPWTQWLERERGFEHSMERYDSKTGFIKSEYR